MGRVALCPELPREEKAVREKKDCTRSPWDSLHTEESKCKVMNPAKTQWEIAAVPLASTGAPLIR